MDFLRIRELISVGPTCWYKNTFSHYKLLVSTISRSMIVKGWDTNLIWKNEIRFSDNSFGEPVDVFLTNRLTITHFKKGVCAVLHIGKCEPKFRETLISTAFLVEGWSFVLNKNNLERVHAIFYNQVSVEIMIFIFVVSTGSQVSSAKIQSS